MCAECDKLEANVARIRRLADPALDARTLATLKEALALAVNAKASFRCDEPSRQRT